LTTMACQWQGHGWLPSVPPVAVGVENPVAKLTREGV